MAVAKGTVYVETTIVSYLTARPTSDLLAAAWQKTTVDWWETQRSRFDFYTSDVALEEAHRGDPKPQGNVLKHISGIPVLEINHPVVALSKALLEGRALPAKAQDDALHLARSAVHGIDYLLTWNFRHLDNAETKPIMRRICRRYRYAMPEICTPQELIGVVEDV